MQFAVLNASKSLSDTDVEFMVAACQAQAVEFCAAYGLDPPAAALYRDVSQLPADDVYICVITDDLNEPGALGYHSDDGHPFIRVLAQGPQTSITLSHEFLELLGDPTCDRWAKRGDGTEVAVEVCLAAETQLRLATGGVAHIADLAGTGDLQVLGADPAGARAERAWNVRLTRRRAPVVAVITSAGVVRCTPEHRVLLASGEYRPAGLLRPGDVLFDVRPGLSQANLADGCGVQAKPPRQLSPRLGGSPNCAHIVIGELGVSVPHSALVPVSGHAALGGRVEHILSMRPHKQVGRVRARRVVAAVTNVGTFRDGSNVGLVRQAMDEVHSSPESDLAVAGRVSRARPAPAAGATDHPARVNLRGGPRRTFGMPGPAGGQVSMSLIPGPMQTAETLGEMFPGTPIDRTRAHGSIVYRVEADGNSDVYDLTVPGTHNVVLASGHVVHNCDPVEGDVYPQVAEVAGEGRTVDVSDYVLPPYFDRSLSGATSRTGLPLVPFGIRPGGYQVVLGRDGNESQVFAHIRACGDGIYAAAAKRRRPDSRLSRRLAWRKVFAVCGRSVGNAMHCPLSKGHDGMCRP